MLALQGNSHDIAVAIALAAVIVVFRRALLRAVIGLVAVVALAVLVAGVVALAQAIHL